MFSFLSTTTTLPDAPPAFDCHTTLSQVAVATSCILFTMLRPIVIHFVPSELLTAFAVACTIVTGAKTSLQWLFSGLPPAVRRRLTTPTLNASPVAPPPSPPVNWTPQPTVTVYKIQYIESSPITLDPYNPYPFSATSSSPFDQWNAPSWASPSDSPYGWDPMVARDALLLYHVVGAFLMVCVPNPPCLFPRRIN